MGKVSLLVAWKWSNRTGRLLSVSCAAAAASAHAQHDRKMRKPAPEPRCSAVNRTTAHWLSVKTLFKRGSSSMRVRTAAEIGTRIESKSGVGTKRGRRNNIGIRDDIVIGRRKGGNNSFRIHVGGAEGES
ncbi:hypothetical protein EVAR_35757_1 [Eumeta japonica]|uniref:Uncharacterized protein n=1 Tax=Eumeta variegata TaxID=151549 RepID=A0A4C1VFB6_EUMVA|nr:hypothetical protein EVAR_35757_1 [Eumeta japonica]